MIFSTLRYDHPVNMYIDISLERWTIRKLMAGAGEGGEVQKKNTLARKN